MLTFPTKAEQCMNAFHAATKTISVATIAKQMDAVVEYDYPFTDYVFDDDTVLRISRKG